MTHDDSMNAEDPHAGMTHDAGTEGTMSHGRPYRMFWLNMIPGADHHVSGDVQHDRWIGRF